MVKWSTKAGVLYDVKNSVNFVSGSFIYSINSTTQANEEYYCCYGVNADDLSIFVDSDLSFSGFDENGDLRALEIKKNRFFVETEFQPERLALSGQIHPLIQAFMRSIENA